MPDTTKPNLVIPMTLWGEVKVDAYRRGVKPVDIVIEMLSEKYDDSFRQSKGMPTRASVKRLRDMVDKIPEVVKASPVAVPEAPKAVPLNTDRWGRKLGEARYGKNDGDPNCKHKFTIVAEGGSACIKCGFQP